MSLADNPDVPDFAVSSWDSERIDIIAVASDYSMLHTSWDTDYSWESGWGPLGGKLMLYLTMVSGPLIGLTCLG